ncbi:MAG TPA: hypothetical protein VGB85_06020 [Nannocystis sp.]|jgi:hypothetical protein
MTPTFAIIAEGPSDFVVLRHILAGYFADSNIVATQLQPAVDDTSGLRSPGGWYEVFRYIGSEKFVGAFERAEFVFVHIDTDVCEEPHFSVSRRNSDGTPRSDDEMLALTTVRLIREISPTVYEQLKSRIIFAIAIESIECWLLPLYYTDRHREKQVNCIGPLNAALSKQEDFSIDVNNKQTKYYFKIVKRLKRKDVVACAPHNPGYSAFVADLAAIASSHEGPASD